MKSFHSVCDKSLLPQGYTSNSFQLFDSNLLAFVTKEFFTLLNSNIDTV